MKAPPLAPPLSKVVLMLLLLMAMKQDVCFVKATWCVTRSDASDQVLQTALDYACGAGADCTPIQSSGLCYLPNTLQAHAAYAFNSYYQRKAADPGSCVFAGTATIAKTDPSYGSCVYPSSPSTAGGTISGGRPGPATMTPAIISVPPPPGTILPFYGPGVVTPVPGSVLPETQNSAAALSEYSVPLLHIVTLLLLFSNMFIKVF